MGDDSVMDATRGIQRVAEFAFDSTPILRECLFAILTKALRINEGGEYYLGEDSRNYQFKPLFCIVGTIDLGF